MKFWNAVGNRRTPNNAGTSRRVPGSGPISAFVKDEDGAIIQLTVIWFLLLFLVTGMATDYMRHETYRAEMQAALDRGLLAAADISQTVDTETTVKEYFKSADWVGGSTVVPTVRVLNDSTRQRTISAEASYEFDTFFLRLIGQPTLKVQVSGKAEERRKDIEISLVLDISGTMRWCAGNSSNCPDGNRIQKLIPAAQSFINTVLTDETRDYTTINIVPYAGHVNTGALLFNVVGGRRTYAQNNNSCIELDANDFDSTDLPSGGGYDQVPHFHWYPLNDTWMEWGWCPSDDVGLTFINNDPDDLNARIEALRYNLHDGTGTDIGLKWGLALLDPDSNSALSPHVATAFQNRPSAYNDEGGLKFVILMTDGQITGQNRPDDPDAEINETVEIRNQEGRPGYEMVSRSTSRGRFLGLCNMARDNGVVVFTIAYMAPSSAQDDMRTCAYDGDTHYFNVDSLDINYAFQEIATTINKIKLIP